MLHVHIYVYVCKWNYIIELEQILILTKYLCIQ